MIIAITAVTICVILGASWHYISKDKVVTTREFKFMLYALCTTALTLVGVIAVVTLR